MNFYAIVCSIMIVASVLVYDVNFKSGSGINDEGKLKSAPSEHSIILNLNHKSDLKLFQTLSITNYTCKSIFLNLMNCSLSFKDELQSTKYLNFRNEHPLLSYTSKTGKNFKVFKLKDGSAHLEVLNTNKMKVVYSFTSTKNLLKFYEIH